MRRIRICLVFLLLTAIIAGTFGCAAATARAGDLMDGITPNEITGRPVDDAFTESIANFSIELFRKGITDGENSLISPLSVMLALAMTANGADGETLAQMESLFGGNIPVSELNRYLYSYVDRLPSHDDAKLNIANSIWFRDDDSLRVEADFLQTNADYFRAQIYSAAFDEQTVNDINDWVSIHTDEMIDSIIDSIDANTVMYLINAIAFDAEWASPFSEFAVRDGIFTDIDGNEQNVDFMHSTEWSFLDDGMATGFIKPYARRSYSFVALLPNDNISIEAYIESLTGAGFLGMLENAQSTEVNASMPKFEYEYSISLVDTLVSLGMIDAFDNNRADFKTMATSSLGNIFIAEVLHKTFISVDELGTRAGAVTMVEPVAESMPMEEPKTVRLDRPFVFAIVDSSTNLPVFIGTLLTV